MSGLMNRRNGGSGRPTGICHGFCLRVGVNEWCVYWVRCVEFIMGVDMSVCFISLV